MPATAGDNDNGEHPDSNMKLETDWNRSKPPLIERYRDFLPVSVDTPIISLQEGGTPLLRASRLEKHLAGLADRPPRLDVYLKYDGANPTADAAHGNNGAVNGPDSDCVDFAPTPGNSCSLVFEGGSRRRDFCSNR